VVTQAQARVATFGLASAQRHTDSVNHADTSYYRDTTTAFRTFERHYAQAKGQQTEALGKLDDDTCEIRVFLDSLVTLTKPFSFLLLPSDFDGTHYKSAVIFTQALPARSDREKQRIIDGQTLVEDAEDTIESNGHRSIRHSTAITPIQARLATLFTDIRDQNELFAIAERDSLVRNRLRVSVQRLRLAMAVDNDLIQAVTQERETYQVLAKSLDLLDTAAVRYAMTAVPHFKLDSLALLGTTDRQYDDKAPLYISADIGVLLATPIFQKFSGTLFSPYAGANIYPLPVNKKAPLKDCEKQPECTIKRFSFTIGITTSSVARTNVRADLFGSHSLFTGLGYRWTSYTRVTAGWLLYQTYTTDGAHTLRFNMTPAISLSFDWDIRSTLGGLGSILGGG
jgi:hypothetical protein